MKKLKMVCILMLIFTISSSTVFPGTSVESVRNGIIETAKSYLGTEYHYGGLGTKGFDCSGFVHHVYLKHGIPIPRMSHNQYRKGRKITLDNARPADLVFFTIRGNRISHVGIYLGNNEFIHAPSRGKEVQVTSLDNSYWKKRFRGAATYIKVSTRDEKN
ncbi:MAG: C40 family peptidase [Spirochaetota bacterium]